VVELSLAGLVSTSTRHQLLHSPQNPQEAELAQLVILNPRNGPLIRIVPLGSFCIVTLRSFPFRNYTCLWLFRSIEGNRGQRKWWWGSDCRGSDAETSRSTVSWPPIADLLATASTSKSWATTIPCQVFSLAHLFQFLNCLLLFSKVLAFSSICFVPVWNLTWLLPRLVAEKLLEKLRNWNASVVWILGFVTLSFQCLGTRKR
jgi:hypothetical protein